MAGDVDLYVCVHLPFLTSWLSVGISESLLSKNQRCPLSDHRTDGQFITLRMPCQAKIFLQKNA
jgi:hypothetical protein